ncbi:MAG: biotin/lipoyl-binding protein [Rhodocyclaceae bacterium]|nr:biotin/lipoyl-binding protein [Rhodocyclaceae bacterium]
MKLKILGIASLALLAAGCSQQEPPAQPLRTVRVMQIDAAAVSGSLTFPGEVRARHESRLAFRIGGKIVERRVDVGAAVKRGQVLARLDAQDVALQAAQAEANRALAEAEAKRYRDLRAKNFVSQAVLDAKETALKTAVAQAGVAKNQAAYAALVADRDGVVTAVEAEAGRWCPPARRWCAWPGTARRKSSSRCRRARWRRCAPPRASPSA